MQVFLKKIYENLLLGSSNVYTDTGVAELLGSVDHIGFFVSVLGVNNVNQTTTCQLETSPDGTRWQNQNTAPELATTGSNLGDNVLFFNNIPGKPIMNFVRVRIALGGTTGPAGGVRIWADGSSFSD
jgi:hypothetical protein